MENNLAAVLILFALVIVGFWIVLVLQLMLDPDQLPPRSPVIWYAEPKP